MTEKQIAYQEKLKKPAWQKRRLEILSRDQFTCQLCGDSETELHVHHRAYSGEPWDAEDCELQALCKHCHSCIELMKDFKSTPVMALKEDYASGYKTVAVLVRRMSGGTGTVIFLYEEEVNTASCMLAITSDLISKIDERLKGLKSVQPVQETEGLENERTSK